MDKSNIGVAHALSGELTTDYFYFYCTMCGNRISHVVFYGVDSVGVKLLARCETCDFSYIFKVKSKPTLGPIQMTSELGSISYKLYDRRRLKKKLRELGHPDV